MQGNWHCPSYLLMNSNNIQHVHNIVIILVLTDWNGGSCVLLQDGQCKVSFHLYFPSLDLDQFAELTGFDAVAWLNIKITETTIKE